MNVLFLLIVSALLVTVHRCAAKDLSINKHPFHYVVAESPASEDSALSLHTMLIGSMHLQE